MSRMENKKKALLVINPCAGVDRKRVSPTDIINKLSSANIEIDANKIKPREGVYATKIRLDEEYLTAVTNIGTRPSVDNFDYITVEALILDFEREIYGEKLVLEVHRFIRNTMKFDSLAEVKAQVDKDVQMVREDL